VLRVAAIQTFLVIHASFLLSLGIRQCYNKRGEIEREV
jgi:hypothetical protein